MIKNLRNSLYLLLLAVVAACGSCAPGSPPNAQPTENVAIEKALRATVRLYASDGDPVCAGTRISPEIVVTAYHCIVAAVTPPEVLMMLEIFGADINDVELGSLVGKKVGFTTYEDTLVNEDSIAKPKTTKTVKAREAFIEDGDPVSDIALLRTPRSDQTYVAISDARLSVGQNVFEIGHPGGEDFSYTRGYVSTPCRVRDGVCMVQADITSWFGSSGGGLFNEAGELIGVCSALALAERAGNDVVGHPGLSFFGNMKALRKLLEPGVEKN